MIERILITDRQSWLEDRKHAVTASEIGALFDCHPYSSSLTLFLDKTGHPAGKRTPDPALVRRGRIFEEAAAAAVREARPDWVVEKAVHYLFYPLQTIVLNGEPVKVGLGATPDYIIRCPRRGRGILQVKTVLPIVFEQQWADIEAPPLWITLQAQSEMMHEEVKWGAVAALVSDPWTWPLHIYEMDARPDVHAEFKAAGIRFWDRVEKNDRPVAQALSDENAVKTLYPTENGNVIDLSGDNYFVNLIFEYNILKEQQKQHSSLEKEIKKVETAIRDKIGDNSGALANDFVVSLPVIERKAYQVHATTYRPIRVKPRVLK